MTRAADRIFTNGTVHPLDGGDTPGADDLPEAVAVRDRRVVRVGSSHEVDFLRGVETDVVDLDGDHLLPGFVDAHTHLDVLGQQVLDADLSDADSAEAALDRLRGADPSHREDDWILGVGYDESRWGGDVLTRADLDSVSDQRPVAAYREDRHVVSVNSVVLEQYRGAMPDGDVRTADGEPTGVLVEGAAEVVTEATEPGVEATREYLLAAQDRALTRGVTAVHEMVRSSTVPRVYRSLDLAGELDVRVRLNYWADFLDDVLGTGLVTNHGSGRVRVGAIKTCADGSIGGRTARLSDPYADADGERGELLTSPAELSELVDRAETADLQVAVHAIGDEAIAAALDALEDSGGRRHRIEHAEVLTDELVTRLGEADVVVSAQPNFLKWAREGGLYDRRLGSQRRRGTNRFRDLQAAGARLAFGSDCMPLDPLFGIQQTVTAPDPRQRLSVTEAVRAYTQGGAYAGFDDRHTGTVRAGAVADFTVLSKSPWAVPDEELATIDVEQTVVDGEVVFRAGG